MDICEYFELSVSKVYLFHKEQSTCQNESEKHWRQVFFVAGKRLDFRHRGEPFACWLRK